MNDMTKPKFIDEVTHVPAEWANAVDVCVFGIFGAPSTLDEVKSVLGLGSLSAQNANEVRVTGGFIDGVVIGSLNPERATFVTASVTDLDAPTPETLVCRAWVTDYVEQQIDALQLGSMSRQNADEVNITGGQINNTPIGQTMAAAGRFTSLECLTQQHLPTSVVTVAYLGEALANATGGRGMVQRSTTPVMTAANQRVLTVPFSYETGSGRLLVIVDGRIAGPDEYTEVNSTTVQFNTAFTGVLPVHFIEL